MIGARLADHSTCEFAAGLFTRDLSRVIRSDPASRSGSIAMAVRAIISCQPGFKQSGLGKDLEREAYFANRKSKSVLISL